jgi:hypothetical protein
MACERGICFLFGLSQRKLKGMGRHAQKKGAPDFLSATEESLLSFSKHH